ncbi:hypothetical protein, partial [Clostridium aceticum]|uniref:hypothetical protein n=1 Tax=Clostridium aceticum TaxID=84022 RepID=UPI001A9A3F77
SKTFFSAALIRRLNYYIILGYIMSTLFLISFSSVSNFLLSHRPFSSGDFYYYIRFLNACQ